MDINRVENSREATLVEAKEILLDIDRDFRFYGWILCLYGSVLSGRGRDIDLLAVPWRPMADVEAACRSLMNRQKATQVGLEYRGLMGTRSFLFLTEDGLILDVQFRT